MAKSKKKISRKCNPSGFRDLGKVDNLAKVAAAVGAAHVKRDYTPIGYSMGLRKFLVNPKNTFATVAHVQKNSVSRGVFQRMNPTGASKTSERGAVNAISGERGVKKNPASRKKSMTKPKIADSFATDIIHESLGIERLKRIPLDVLEKTIDNWVAAMMSIHSKDTVSLIAAYIREAEKIFQIRRKAERGSLPNPASRSDVRSPTSTKTEVRSPTSTRTEVRSPTSTSTSTRADTRGNFTVTGGAGSGDTTINVRRNGPVGKKRKRNPESEGSPNLDGMNPDELMTFWFKHQRGRGAKMLFPAKPKGFKKATSDLANYASNKATAMRQREMGIISDAQRYEQICDRIYDGLPDFATW